MSTIHKVFVYGTLKRGEPNHHWFNKATDGVANFVCNAKTQEKYPLVIATKYNIPFVLHRPGTGHNVLGELYEVDNITLANLDNLEDHPNYYVREQTSVLARDDATLHANTWIYFLKNFKADLLQKPMLTEYSNNGSHGLRYMERYLRDPVYDHKSAVLKKINNESTLEDLEQ